MGNEERECCYVDNKPVKNDAGEISMREEAKQNAWAEHFERLLNVEFEWDREHLSNEQPLEGPPIPITTGMVKKAISKMESGKAAGKVVEMIKPAWYTWYRRHPEFSLRFWKQEL